MFEKSSGSPLGDRRSRRAALAGVLYALASGMACISLALAWWSWQAGRRFSDQLQRAARIQAEVLSRDFSEDFRISSNAQLRRALAPVLSDAVPWSNSTADSLQAIAERSPLLRDVVQSSYYWSSTDSAVVYWTPTSPMHARAMIPRIAAEEPPPGPLMPPYTVLKADEAGREIFVFKTTRRLNDRRLVSIGFSGDRRAFVATIMRPLIARVGELRLGAEAEHIAAWEILSPGGDTLLRVGARSQNAVTHTAAFWRTRQAPETSSVFSSFLATSAVVHPAVGVNGRPDPRYSPWLVSVHVDPAGIADALYGARALPQVFVGMLLMLSLALTIATVVLARRLVRHATERETFATTVAHELRTPLTQILLHAETLQLDRAAAKTRQDAARVVVRETRRLIYLVENALQFVRGRRSAMQLNVRSVHLAPVISETLDGLEPIGARALVHVERELDESVVAPVDAGALRQMLGNLFENAARFGPPGQTITVRSWMSGNRARLSVEDQGPGIPPDDRMRVFEPYVHDPRHAGNGLGLAVVRQLVELHDGRVWIEDGAIGARVVIEFAPDVSRPAETFHEPVPTVPA